jgi:hypothetical protein
MELDELISRAFSSSDARNASEAIDRARQTAGGSPDKPLRSYELVLKPGQTLQELASSAVPLLIYHLESLGSHPPECGGIFLSLFVEARVHFISMKDAVAIFAQVLGRTMESLVEEYGTHELRHAIELAPRSPPSAEPSSTPLLLPVETGPKP